MNDVLKTVVTQRIDFELIMNIKELREAKGWSQRKLSHLMGLSANFVGKCESFAQPEKFNLRHLITLSSIFDFEKIGDFFPNGIPNDERIMVRYKKIPKKRKDGSESKILEDVVIEIIPLTR